MESSVPAIVDLWRYETRCVAVSSVSLVLATLSVVLRFVARAKNGAGFKVDDWIIIPSLLTYYGFSTVRLLNASEGGLGIQPQFLTPSQAVLVGKANYINPLLSVPVISLAKLSILCLYYRAFPSTRFRQWVLIVGATVVAWMIGCFFATVLQCIPPRMLWDPSVHGRCIDLTLFFQCIEPINFLQDVIMAVMPVGVIRRLHLDRAQKVSLCFIFLLGGLVAIISLVRIVIVSIPTASFDALYSSSDWLAAQLCLAILCANLLTYRPLFPKWLPSGRSRNRLHLNEYSGSATRINNSWIRLNVVKAGDKSQVPDPFGSEAVRL